jgi:hypothetical protein
VAGPRHVRREKHKSKGVLVVLRVAYGMPCFQWMRSRVDNVRENPGPRPDEWGRDPSVRAMRRVFAAMEAAQKEFTKNLGLSPFDQRLRRWRERALGIFDVLWARAAGADLELSEEEAGALYVQCLGKTMTSEGMDVPLEILPRSEKLEKILKEVFP